jgi:hypothetical protein
MQYLILHAISQRTSNDNTKLVQLIQQHIFNTTAIDVTKLVLSRAGNPACYLATDGKVKVEIHFG